jgi:isopropylmalate/homocitrate/citramalate synthase
VDTMGVASVPAAHYFVRRMRERVKKPLEAHFHNDFGLANANSLAAIEEGAEVIHSTVLGMGERAGQASTEQIALALELLYGFHTGIRLDKLYDLCRLVSDLAPHAVAVNQPVVGDRIFQVESGIPATWWLRVRESHPTEVFALLPSLMGQKPVELVLGKGSGAESIAYFLQKAGLEASSKQIQLLSVMVKYRSMEKKGLVTEDEFRGMATKVLAGEVG